MDPKRQIAAESVETENAGNEVFDRSLNGGDKKESGSDVEPRKTPDSTKMALNDSESF